MGERRLRLEGGGVPQEESSSFDLDSDLSLESESVSSAHRRSNTIAGRPP